MADGGWSRERYGEAFWRTHHEAWRQSDLNQREYCEAQGISLKAFGNWRAKFKAEPQPPARKLLYRRGGLSHRLSHTLGHSVSHMTNGSPEPTLIVPPARDGHRRSFSEADKRRIVEQAAQPGASLSELARRYGIAARVLFRWKQELKPSAAPMFVTVQIADAGAPSDAALSRKGACVMTLLPRGLKIHLALGYTDMRKGIDGLAMLVQAVLRQDPFSGHLFVFRGRKANLIKIVYWDGTGLCLFSKRLEQGVFLWPPDVDVGETLALSSEQLSMLIDGVDWRTPERRWRPAVAG